MLTLDQVKEALPKTLKTAADQKLVDKINTANSDPMVAEHIRENFVSYAQVLKEGKYRLEDYLNAVTYVSFKLMNQSNQNAYKYTFPKRYQDLRARGATDKDISAYVHAYNKGKLVNEILEQTLIPTWVLNQDAYQKAINVQTELMLTANSEKVRAEAANSLLTHLKRPETKDVNLNIGVQETDGMKELNEMLSSLAQRQQEVIRSGVGTKTIAHQGLGETIDITPNSEQESHHTKAKQGK